jgi:AraC family transcriptional regulator
MHAVGWQASTPVTTAWLDDQLTLDHQPWHCKTTEMTWRADQHLLVLTESGGTGYTEIRMSGERPYVGLDRPGAISFVPAGAERLCRYRDATLDYTALWIDPQAVAAWGLATPAPLFNGADPLIMLHLADLARASREGCAPDELYMSHLVALLLLRLAGRRAPAAQERPSAGLSTQQLRRVTDHVDAHLGNPLRLRGLARLAGLEVDAFARRFKRSTGLAPYQYVMQRRVERAQRLLRSSAREAGEIGLAVGFASASHFATAFRRHVGCSPLVWRRADA